MIIQLKNIEKIGLDEAVLIQSELDFLKNGSISNRLKKAEILSKNKDEAGLWLKKAIQVEHTYFQKHPSDETASTLKTLFQAYTVIRTSNANVRLTLENCFLTL